MGGFIAFDGDKPVGTLLPEKDRLKGYSLTGRGDFPTITKEEILDKSKSDIISKLFVLLQAAWFLVQCLARVTQHLPITELELATIAYVAINFVIFALWIDKPLNVQRALRVYKKPNNNGENRDISLSTQVRLTGRSPETFCTCGWQIMFLPLHGLIKIAIGEFGIIDEDDRIATFYPGYLSPRMGILVAITETIVATGFGAIHMIAWDFAFPSDVERMLWHVSSAIVTGSPAIYVLLGLLCYSRGNFPILVAALETILALSTMTSRVFLLVLPFLALRSVPPDIYHSVKWTTYIPHL